MKKLAEAIILKKLKETEKERQIPDEQFRFRQNAWQKIPQMVKYITNKFNHKKATAAVLLYVSKVFDTKNCLPSCCMQDFQSDKSNYSSLLRSPRYIQRNGSKGTAGGSPLTIPVQQLH